MNIYKKYRWHTILILTSLGLIIFSISFAPKVLKNSVVEDPVLSYARNENILIQQDTKIKLLFLGDVMLARTIGDSILNGSNPFENVKDKFKEYDLVIANLETTVSKNEFAIQNPYKLYTFNAPIESLSTLLDSGISAVSLANNHTKDYGANALVNTMDNLNEKGLVFFGAGKNVDDAFAPKYVLIKQTKIALLAFNDIENWVADAGYNIAGSANFDVDRIINSLQEARKNADIVIVFPHWGIEYDLNNSQRQTEFAKLFIDNGADIVIGGHPHVLQNVGEHYGKKIYYSLGNFVFDNMCPIANACNAAMAEINIQDKKIVDSNLIPIEIENNGYPKLK